MSTLSASPSRFVTVFRAVFFWCGLAALNYNLDANLSPFTLLVAALVGASLGRNAAELKTVSGARLTQRGFFAIVTGAVIAWHVLRYAGDLINPGSSAFGWYVFSRSLELSLAVGLSLAVLEWLYRRTASWLTVECVLLAGIAIYGISEHRLFRLDSPKSIASMAWDWNANPIGVFIGVGAALAALVVLFASVCARPAAPRSQRARSRTIAASATLAAALIAVISVVAFKITTVTAGSRLMNGVGQNNSEGVSPLTFQSALGATNQPSAVVRLEGDYKDNPTSPMLYLREDALSAFNGTEMVHAGAGFDQDVIETPPDQIFKGEEDTDLSERTPLPHSVYLLADHKIPFAIDFPVSLVPLKNPTKFKGGAYRVYSQAPVYKLDALSGLPVGDPRWDAIERAHYLKTSPDIRYRDRAIEITRDAKTPVERAFSLSGYLSQKSIYTLAPNHAETKGDLTAPYLFGDMRGYCVHFAHAMVYMLRSIGIPSRIGTGYLTDLSQAKDGHILLRMSDRHAWAEVYITTKGWVPFDVQPEQVESHGDSEVDQKLLEDLMSQLDPGEEILPKDPPKPEPALDREKGTPWADYLPSSAQLLGLLFGIVTSLILLKAFLRLVAWRLVSSPRRRLSLAYRAEAMHAADFNVVRELGETRLEFEARAKVTRSIDVLPITGALNAARFGGADIETSAPRFCKPKSFTERLIVWLSPLSIRRFFNP
jgi:hypothetical protein